MTRQQRAEVLYQKIQEAYQPSYFPTKEEKSEAVFELQNLLFKEIDEDSIIRKAKALSEMHGDHKTKVTTLIMNKFWTVPISIGVKANKFIQED
jgi:hypothetical protein